MEPLAFRVIPPNLAMFGLTFLLENNPNLTETLKTKGPIAFPGVKEILNLIGYGNDPEFVDLIVEGCKPEMENDWAYEAFVKKRDKYLSKKATSLDLQWYVPKAEYIVPVRVLFNEIEEQKELTFSDLTGIHGNADFRAMIEDAQKLFDSIVLRYVLPMHLSGSCLYDGSGLEVRRILLTVSLATYFNALLPLSDDPSTFMQIFMQSLLILSPWLINLGRRHFWKLRHKLRWQQRWFQFNSDDYHRMSQIVSSFFTNTVAAKSYYNKDAVKEFFAKSGYTASAKQVIEFTRTRPRLNLPKDINLSTEQSAGWFENPITPSRVKVALATTAVAVMCYPMIVSLIPSAVKLPPMTYNVRNGQQRLCVKNASGVEHRINFGNCMILSDGQRKLGKPSGDGYLDAFVSNFLNISLPDGTKTDALQGNQTKDPMLKKFWLAKGGKRMTTKEFTTFICFLSETPISNYYSKQGFNFTRFSDGFYSYSQNNNKTYNSDAAVPTPFRCPKFVNIPFTESDLC